MRGWVAIILTAVAVATPAVAMWGLRAWEVNPWWAAGAAVILALPLVRHCRGGMGWWCVGVAVAALAGAATPTARNMVEATIVVKKWPHFDLSQDAVPADAPPYIEVTGVLRRDWVLDEYAVSAEGLPDQSRPAEAVLVPMAPNPQGSATLRGAVVVARLERLAGTDGETTTLRGKAEPLPSELLTTLVAVGDPSSASVQGVLLDTTDVPTVAAAVYWVAAVLVLLLVSAVAFGLGRRSSLQSQAREGL